MNVSDRDESVDGKNRCELCGASNADKVVINIPGTRQTTRRWVCQDHSEHPDWSAESGEQKQQDDLPTVACRFCERNWSFGSDPLDTRYIAEIRRDTHEEREHYGRARVTVTLEVEWQVHPGTTARNLSDAAHKSFEEHDGPFEVAYSSAEILDEADDLDEEDSDD